MCNRRAVAFHAISGMLILLTTAAYAAPSAEPASYCTVPGLALGMTPEQIITSVQAKCQVGDILQLPESSTYAMVKLCDFNRTIINSPTIACVFAGKRPDR
jgi:hypothetical protein